MDILPSPLREISSISTNPSLRVNCSHIFAPVKKPYFLIPLVDGEMWALNKVIETSCILRERSSAGRAPALQAGGHKLIPKLPPPFSQDI